MKKIIKSVLFLLMGLLLLAMSYVLIYFPGVMTGMDAKIMCSCVYVMGRTPESVKSKELKVFPGLTWADFIFDDQDSSVTAKLLWMESKAIFRRGLGCTLLAERSEDEVRSQQINAPSSRYPANARTILWPSGDSLIDKKIVGVNYEGVNSAINSAFADIDSLNPVNTHAVVVVYNGELIAEKYAEGFDSNSRLAGWSMTKSITNALIGILVREGKLNIHDPAPIQEWQNDERKKITIHDLLHASSGLDWQESYFIPTSDFHTMFIHRDDKPGFAASQNLKHQPGTVFQYSSGTTNILSRIIRQTVGDREYYKFPYNKLFYKVGMYSALMEPDASGTFVASSYSYASARDWARFGLLYLDDGVWNNERILPEGWVKYSITPAPAANRRQYGAQIWLNLGRIENPLDSYAPGAPPDTFLFEGFEENSVAVIPSKNLVIVRLGVTHNNNFNLVKLINSVIGNLPEKQH
jgi:CubicO group peptidase (beta-lactamase class C family)